MTTHRKSSFLVRARKLEGGERVELTHLESQVTSNFTSLEAAVTWLRARWADWDARIAEPDESPGAAAPRQTRLAENAWRAIPSLATLKGGHLMDQLLKLNVRDLAIGAIGGLVVAVALTLGQSGALSLSAGSSKLDPLYIGRALVHVTAAGNSETFTTTLQPGSTSGVNGVAYSVDRLSGSTFNVSGGGAESTPATALILCFDLTTPARIAIAPVTDGSSNVQAVAATSFSAASATPDAQGHLAQDSWSCPANDRDAAFRVDLQQRAHEIQRRYNLDPYDETIEVLFFR